MCPRSPGAGRPPPPGRFLWKFSSRSRWQRLPGDHLAETQGGATEIGGVVFNGEDACIAFAREHLTREVTYHCIPSHMFAMCMPLDDVIYKDDMQGDEMLAVRTSHNPMQSAVILLVHTTIPPILWGTKDSSLGRPSMTSMRLAPSTIG